MKFLPFLLVLFGTSPLFGQKSEDTKIIITVNDSIGIYNKIKYSLVNNDFIVKDNGNKDTLTTYQMEYDGMFCIAKAIIKDNTITLFGFYGLKRIDDWGYTQTPKGYNQIMYYKGSIGWKLLIKVAEGVNGQITYSK